MSSGRYSRSDPSHQRSRSRYDEPAEEDEFMDRASYQLQNNESGSTAEDDQPRQEDAGIFRDNSGESEGSEDVDMSLSEVLYSVSSFYAIVVPGEEICFENDCLLPRIESTVCLHLPLLSFLLSPRSLNHNDSLSINGGVR